MKSFVQFLKSLIQEAREDMEKNSQLQSKLAIFVFFQRVQEWLQQRFPRLSRFFSWVWWPRKLFNFYRGLLSVVCRKILRYILGTLWGQWLLQVTQRFTFALGLGMLLLLVFISFYYPSSITRNSLVGMFLLASCVTVFLYVNDYVNPTIEKKHLFVFYVLIFFMIYFFLLRDFAFTYVSLDYFKKNPLFPFALYVSLSVLVVVFSVFLPSTYFSDTWEYFHKIFFLCSFFTLLSSYFWIFFRVIWPVDLAMPEEALNFAVSVRLATYLFSIFVFFLITFSVGVIEVHDRSEQKIAVAISKLNRKQYRYFLVSKRTIWFEKYPWIQEKFLPGYTFFVLFFGPFVFFPSNSLIVLPAFFVTFFYTSLYIICFLFVVAEIQCAFVIDRIEKRYYESEKRLEQRKKKSHEKREK